MDEGIIEGSEDTSDAKDHFTYDKQISKGGLRMAIMSTFANLRAQGDVLRGRTFDLLLGRHLEVSVDEIRTSC